MPADLSVGQENFHKKDYQLKNNMKNKNNKNS